MGYMSYRDVAPAGDEGTLLPDDFPTREQKAAAAVQHPELPIEQVAADFRWHHTQLQEPRRSWNRAWLAWLRNAPKDYADVGRQRPRPVRSATDARERASAQRIAALAARYAVSGQD